MRSDRFRWVARLLREAASWAFFLLGIALGGLSTTIFAGSPVAWSYQVEWSRFFGFGLLGFVLLLASILALRNRRQAAWVSLLVAPLAGGCLAWWQRMLRYDGHFSVRQTILVFAGTAALLIVPGFFWLITGRRKWPPLISVLSTAGANPRQPAVLNMALFSFVVFVCAVASLYAPLFELDCGGRPPVSVQTSPQQAVFTARVMFIGRSWFSKEPRWALLRVERIYWGLPRWMAGIVILRSYFREADQGRQYFVDAYRSQGALTRFLPVVEHYPCCHTAFISDAEADLRVLRDGPPKSSVRIIGRVYSFLPRGMKFVPAVRVEAIGPRGSVFSMTDEHGIYDLKDLPPGRYSLRLGSVEHGGTDLKAGDVWGGDLWLPNSSPGP